MQPPAEATEDRYPGGAGSGGVRTFVPLRPQLELAGAGHLRLVSLSPQGSRRADLDNGLRHPLGALVAEVFLPVLSDGSLGLYYPRPDRAAGRTHPRPGPGLAAPTSP